MLNQEKTPRQGHIFAALALLIILGMALFTAIRGVNYGDHVDEPRLINSVADSAKTGLLLPTWYNYPSMSYNLEMIGFAPYAANYILHHLDKYRGLSTNDLVTIAGKDLSGVALSLDFKLYTRTIFIAVSFLSILWVYILVYRWRRSYLEALLAAALLSGSWELNYHTRYIAPDAVMMAFGILAVMLVIFAQTSHDASWAQRYTRLAAIVAGLTCGTKYQGGLFLIPIFLSLIVSIKPFSIRKLPLREFFISVVLFTATFLFTTPGALLQPVEFFRDVLFEMGHYASGHGVQSVTPGVTHLHLILGYLGLVALSKYTAIAILCTVFVAIGAIAIMRDDWRIGIVFVAFPVLYILYMSRQSVMFVRNYLVVFPFLAILAARGVFFLTAAVQARVKMLNRPTFRYALPVLFAVLWIINTLWLVKAADNIVNPVQVNQIEQAALYIDQRPSTQFFITARVAADLTAFDGKTRPNVSRTFQDGQQVMFYAGELAAVFAKTDQFLPINRFSFYTYLPPDVDRVNPNYFDLDSNRIVLLDYSKFKDLNVTLP